MCGICGIVDFYRQLKDKKELTHVMSSNLSHEVLMTEGIIMMNLFL